MIQGRVITQIYAENELHGSPIDNLRLLDSNLNQWRDSLSSAVVFDPTDEAMPTPPPHVLSLQYVDEPFCQASRERRLTPLAWCIGQW